MKFSSPGQGEKQADEDLSESLRLCTRRIYDASLIVGKFLKNLNTTAIEVVSFDDKKFHEKLFRDSKRARNLILGYEKQKPFRLGSNSICFHLSKVVRSFPMRAQSCKQKSEIITSDPLNCCKSSSSSFTISFTLQDEEKCNKEWISNPVRSLHILDLSLRLNTSDCESCGMRFIAAASPSSLQ